MAIVLLVDDDADYAEMFAELLRERGHRVHLAPNGRGGLAAALHLSPDVVVLDIDMPVMNGPDTALQMLLRDAGQERIPIVFISGSVHVREIAGRVGTDYFLTKPADASVILALIDRAVAEHRAPTWPGDGWIARGAREAPVHHEETRPAAVSSACVTAPGECRPLGGDAPLGGDDRGPDAERCRGQAAALHAGVSTNECASL